MNIYMDYETNYTRKVRNIKVPRGMDKISPVKPRTNYYHYSSDDSQGALICQTKGFPNYFNREKQDYHSAYSDRIMSWDYDRFKKACDIAGCSDGAWAYRLPRFNISSGYSCPTVEAIVDK